MGTTRDVSAAIRTGFVESTDVEEVTARVRVPDLDDLISYDLQILQQNTRENKDVWMPDLQEEVVCLFMGNGLECGFVLGSVYNREDRPPVKSQDKRHITFKDGTWFEYDRKEHRARAHVEGHLDIFATGDINIRSEEGTVWINGVQVRLNDLSAPKNAAITLEYVDG